MIHAFPPTLTFSLDSREDSTAQTLGVDLECLTASRLLVQANSGGGKSWAVRYLLEQTHGNVQQFVIDPEGEFATLRQCFPYVLVGASGDIPADPDTAGILCQKLMELHVSAIVDLSDLKLRDRRRFVRHFLESLITLPNALWHPLIVAIDECHLYAPERGFGDAESTQAVIDLATLGRKRGFCLVAATQRLSKLSKDVAAELKNKLIGSTGLDVDVRRAGDDLGFERKQRDSLKTLEPGTFYAVGPAICTVPTIVRTGDVITSHPQPGKIAPAPPPAPDQLSAIIAQLQQLQPEPEPKISPVENQQQQHRIHQLEQQVQHLQQALTNEREKAESVAHKLFDLHSLLLGKPQLDPQQEVSESEIHLPKSEVPAVNFVRVLDEEKGTQLKRPASQNSEGALLSIHQRILDAIAFFEQVGIPQPKRSNVAIFCGLSHTAGYFKNNVSNLRQKGLLDYPDAQTMQLTDDGRALSRSTIDFHSNTQLHQLWITKLPNLQARLLQILIDHYPDAMSRQALADAVELSSTAGYFKNNLSALRSLSIVDYPDPKSAIATELLFPLKS